MNISAINNYQADFIHKPVSKIKPPEGDDNIPSSDKSLDRSMSSDNNQGQNNTDKTMVNGSDLTRAELRLLDELQQIDAKVRRHEMAHMAAGGQYITSGANFTYKRGPDGRNYAVGGEVSIDTSPVPGDPKATLRKMRQVQSAALAPANPSPQDIKVASKASQAAAQALSDIMISQAEDRAATNEDTAFKDLKKAADSYEKVGRLPKGELSSFWVAV